jgi:hypothetical protein
VTITVQALSLVGKAGPVQVHFTLRLEGGTNGVCECKMDGEVYVDSYMASIGSCFMVIWTVFKNRRETMASRMFTIVGLFYFIIHEDPHD